MEEFPMSSMPTMVLADQPVVWTPGPEQLNRSRALAFARRHGLDGWDGLCQRAIEDPAWFCEAVCDELGIVWKQRFDVALDLADGPEWPRWFVGGRMNYVTSALDRFLGSRADAVAVRWEGEDGTTATLTYQELTDATNRMANALRALGVTKGDRVGIYLPMLPETAVATLACSRIGAVFIPIFSGYGADAAAARLTDAGAKVLITADGFERRGRLVPMKQTANEAVSKAPSVEHVIVVKRSGGDSEWVGGRDLWWHELAEAASPICEPADTAADDPYMLIYTSGTTGAPKGTVHVHAGFPIKAAQDLAFCFDLQDDDRLFWITDLGWMMGPWMIAGGLIAGASIVLYEGTPDFPEPDRVWQIVERHGVTVLGISPTLVRSMMGHENTWVDRHQMTTLRALGSTGEPWNPGPWQWAFDHIGKGRCPIVNYSGGTEIGGGIVAATTIHPQKPCAFSSAVPGVPADVVNEKGQPVRGEVGELAIRGPWVGMTNGFWQDRERYLDTYWARIPGLWVHGDWALIDDDGFWYILGRSDDTLNVAGKRVGPAEIESAAVAHPAVREAAAIGVPHEIKGESIVVFVVLNSGHDESEEIRSGIRDIVTQHLGRPMRPDLIMFVDDLPKTRNAKIMRRVIRGRYLNQRDLGDLSSLENIDAVEGIGNAR
jgi:acetyl-CoA synthetase